jgi:hypothetical protein
MDHYTMFVSGEWLCGLSFAMFFAAGIEAICRSARS